MKHTFVNGNFIYSVLILFAVFQACSESDTTVEEVFAPVWVKTEGIGGVYKGDIVKANDQSTIEDAIATEKAMRITQYTDSNTFIIDRISDVPDTLIISQDNTADIANLMGPKNKYSYYYFGYTNEHVYIEAAYQDTATNETIWVSFGGKE